METPAPVKVYGPVMSPAVSRVLGCLLEKDVPFQLINVNMSKGEHKSPEFLKLQVRVNPPLSLPVSSCLANSMVLILVDQPFGQVPAFQDEAIALFGNLPPWILFIL